MKKFYLSALGCLMAVGASAQTFNPVNSVVNGYMLGSINKEFTNTGKGIVYTMEEGDNAVEFKLYDEQFNVTKTLNVYLNTNYDRQVTEKREAVVTKSLSYQNDYTDDYEEWLEDIFADQLDEMENWPEDSIHAIISSPSLVSQYIERRGYTVDSVYTTGTNTFFVVSYYDSYEYGKLYPSREFCLEKKYDDTYGELYWIFSVLQYSYESAYTGEWVTETNHYSSDNSTHSYYLDLDACAMTEAPTSSLFATQSLFNNDSKLEFIRRVYEEIPDDSPYEQDRDYDGEVDYCEMNYDSRTMAFEIVNEDNEVLANIDCPKDSYGSYPYVFKWGDNHYIGIFSTFRGEYHEDYYEYEMTYSWDIYLIENSTNSVRKVNAAPLMSVIPTLANRNSTVNVTLDAETAKNGGELIITDSNGRAIGRRRVEAGQTSVPVTTDRMVSGVYNITLTEKGQKVENARIIVK